MPTLAELNELTSPLATDLMLVRRNSDTADPDKRMALDKIVWAVGNQTIAGAKTLSNLLTLQAGANFGQSTLNYFQTRTPNLPGGGTWLPTVTGSVSNPTVTYGSRAGSWSRIGDVVFYEFQVSFNAISGGSGDALFSLPHVPLAGVRSTLLTTGITYPANTATLNFVPLGAAYGRIDVIVSAGAQQVVSCAMLAAGQFIIAGGYYWVTP